MPSQEAEDEDFTAVRAMVERFDEAKRTVKHGKLNKAEILEVERSQLRAGNKRASEGSDATMSAMSTRGHSDDAIRYPSFLVRMHGFKYLPVNHSGGPFWGQT
jgi:hypothetical protein